jgi:hypothetical protein
MEIDAATALMRASVYPNRMDSNGSHDGRSHQELHREEADRIDAQSSPAA